LQQRRRRPHHPLNDDDDDDDDDDIIRMKGSAALSHDGRSKAQERTDITTNEGNGDSMKREGTTTDGCDALHQVDLDRLADLLSVYWTYHLPPRNHPRILNGEYPLHIVVNRLDSDNKETTLEAVGLLVKLGANVNIQDRNDQTALHRLFDRLTPENQPITFSCWRTG